MEIKVSVKVDRLIIRLNGYYNPSKDNIDMLHKQVSEYISDFGINHLIIDISKLKKLDDAIVDFIILKVIMLKKKKGDVYLCCGSNEMMSQIIGNATLNNNCIVVHSVERANEILDKA